jgi:hypothetical protein
MKKDHRFFKKTVGNNLADMSAFSKEVNDNIKNRTGYDMKDAWLVPVGDINHNVAMDSWHITYNIFEYENEGIQNIKKAIKDLIIEACDYYGIDPKEQKYMLKGHLNYYAGPKEMNWEKIAWDNHGDDPFEFHGYYCINAEPSVTYYQILGNIVENENKNDLALLSQNGYHHSVGAWLSKDVRITIGYNVFPLNKVPQNEKTISAGTEVYGWDPIKKEYTKTILDREVSYGQWIPLT